MTMRKLFILPLICAVAVSCGAWIHGSSGPDVTPPTITSAASTSVAENAALSFTITTNEAATVVIGGADAAQVELASNPLATSRVLRRVGNGTFDFETPLDTGGNNVYDITITATDAASNVGSAQNFALTVTDVDDTDVTAPVITSAASTSVAENATLSFTIITDEAATVVIGGADAAQVELASNPLATSRVLRWSSNGTRNFEAPADAGGNNVYDLTFTPTDGASNVGSAQNFALTVTDVAGPTMTSANSANNAENSVLSFALTASASSTFAITGGADAAQFSISGSNLRWVANGTKDFEAPDDVGENNTYVAEVTPTSTVGSEVGTPQTITITVTDVVDESGNFLLAEAPSNYLLDASSGRLLAP